MSKSIISALRCLPQLRGSTFLAAVEIAHRVSDTNGIGYVSYSLLAAKSHQSRRTAIRQVQRLIDLGIIAVQRFYRPGGLWGVNQYRFLIRWTKPRAYPPDKNRSGDKVNPMFPREENTSEKYGTLGEVEKAKHRALAWLTPGSQLYAMTEAIQVPSVY